MILLAVVAFLFALIGAGFIVRRMRGHARRYGKDLPQRFHMGHIPRLGGLAMFASMVLTVGAAGLAAGAVASSGAF